MASPTQFDRSLLMADRRRAWWTLPLIRMLVGVVFLTEGLQKFMYPEIRGPGRFEGMGFPEPEFFAYFVGGFEVVCGFLILIGFITRIAAIPTLVIMIVALLTTKVPILLGQELWIFEMRDVSVYGVMGFLHESRNDLAMLVGSIVLIYAGAGPWSVDAALADSAGGKRRLRKVRSRRGAGGSG